MLRRLTLTRVAQLIALFATLLLGYQATFDDLRGPFPWLWGLLAFELLVIFLMGRRKNRFAAVTWFALTMWVPLAILDGEVQDNGWYPIAASAARLAVCVLFMWPRQAPARNDARLPSLHLSWVVLSTFIVSFAALAICTLVQPTFERGAFVAAASAALMFWLLSIFSRFGVARWVLIPVGLLIAYNILHRRGPVSGADELQRMVVVVGSLAFVAAFDWLRAPARARDRFLRTALAVFIPSFLVPAIAAPAQVLALTPVLAVAIWSAAFGLVLALAPRLATRAHAQVRLQLRSPRRQIMPRRLWIPFAVFLAIVGGSFILERDFGTRVTFAVIAFVLVLPRVRWLVHLGVAIYLVVLINIGLERFTSSSSGKNMLFLLAIVGSWVIARWASYENILAAKRRIRPYFQAQPRVAFTAGGAALAMAAVTLFAVFDERALRSIAISDVFGPVVIKDTPVFEVDRAIELPNQTSQTSGTVAIDPLGRGTWIVDEELDAVSLISTEGKVRSFSVGGWPEQLIVASDGRVYISCRHHGSVFVIEPDLKTRSIAVGVEPRALVLDEPNHRLYVGLVTPRAVVALDTDTFSVLGRYALHIEPRVMAQTEQGLAVLPRLGSEVVFLSADLTQEKRVPLSADRRKAWHGQALVSVGPQLIVLHTAVDTGLSAPVSTGGYGGGVDQPIDLMVSIIRDGEPTFYPSSAMWRRIFNGADVTAAMWRNHELLIASRGTDQIASWTPRDSFRNSVASGSGITGFAYDKEGTLWLLAAFDRYLISKNAAGVTAHSMGKGRFDEELALGRKLFHKADRKISGSMMSCATCHPDGREDGLVWRLKGTMRQTPLLAGRLLPNTAPFNWTGGTETLDSNIHETVRRLGGSGLSGSEVAALERYIQVGLRAPVRPPRHDAELVAEGRRVFEDTTVGCANCHDGGNAFTDGLRYDVGSTSAHELKEMRVVEPWAKAPEMDVPSLLYVGLSAPYFHDGSAKSLEEVIAHNGDRMGRTSGLSEAERGALIAYLASL